LLLHVPANSPLPDFLKRLAARLPLSWQQELRRHHFHRQIRRGVFGATIPEYELLASLLAPGDWVIDVGANVGQYTKRFSDLVGPGGRVIAIEPVPETFALLAANVALFQCRNVSPLNLAASAKSGVAGIQIPRFETGLPNYYCAQLTHASTDLQVLACPLDSLGVEHRVKLVKVDAEGHDAMVLRGAERLLRRDRPILLIEGSDDELVDYLSGLAYRTEQVAGSINFLCR